MMNKHVQIHAEPHAFIEKDRIRLYTERNQFKFKFDEAELALYYEKKRNRAVIALLMVIIFTLLGALLYVMYR